MDPAVSTILLHVSLLKLCFRPRSWLHWKYLLVTVPRQYHNTFARFVAIKEEAHKAKQELHSLDGFFKPPFGNLPRFARQVLESSQVVLCMQSRSVCTTRDGTDGCD